MNTSQLAMTRFDILKPYLYGGVPLSQAARESGVALRTAQRWLAHYKNDGLKGLERSVRGDAGRHKLHPDIVTLIEGMALCHPMPSVTSIYRRCVTVAQQHDWSPPSYSSVYAIIRALDPAMVTMAQDGNAAFRDRFELVYRRQAERPNAIWQADHTLLDIQILDANGKPARPWLTTIIDDYSRAVAGYTVFLGAPSALQTSLALRQAMWRKPDPQWPVCGIPDILYTDHGSDFTSQHLEQVAADLRMELVHSIPGRPQGRGKVERLFGSLNTELLSELPGHLIKGKPVTPPRLSLTELDAAIQTHILGTYHTRKHGETGIAPRVAWIAQGWLPRLPECLEDLDLLLIMVAKARIIHRDGIHFQGIRYLSPTMAAYVGEDVTIRYDPRDISEIRVFHHHHFLCRAISPEHASQTITLKDIQTARNTYRRAVRGHIRDRIARVTDFLPESESQSPESPTLSDKEKPSRLLTYYEDKS